MKRRLPSRGQRGVALLMVLILLSLVGVVVGDFMYSSQVDVELAYHARDDLQAEYNALSALRFRALLLRQARTLQPLLAGLAGGQKPPPIGAVMEMIPVECGLLSQLLQGDSFERHDDADFFVGDCLATAESEHSKVPVNLLRTPEGGLPVARMLMGILQQPRLRRFFEQDDRNGQHAQSPAELIGAISDWVDANHSGQGSLGDEDRFYQSAEPPYRSKNAPLDSVAELGLVHGIGDGLMEVLKDRVSVVTSSAQIDLATAPLEMVLTSMAGALDSPEAVEAYYGAIGALAARLNILRSLGPLMPLNLSLLKMALSDVGLMNLLNPAKLDLIFTDGSNSTWYTILAQGQMGKASRRLRVTFQADEGVFYYARVE